MNRRVLYGRLGGQAKLNALIRSLSPAAWFRQGVGITVTGSGVSQWDDQSGNGRHLLQGTDAARPIYLPFSGTRYLYLPGVANNYASTPDSVANSITGDIDLIVDVQFDDYTPAANMALIQKDDFSTARSYRFILGANGFLSFLYTSDGSTATGRVAAASSNTGATDGTRTWLRCTYVAATGKVNFYKSTNGSSWTAVGTEQTITSGAIADTNRVVEIGGSGASGGVYEAKGKIYRAIIKNGIDGTTVVDFNPADADGDGDTSFASSATGETWTVNSSGALPAQIVGRAAILFNGTSHYLKTNAFTLNQPEWVLWVGKQVSWSGNDCIFDGDATFSMSATQAVATPRIDIYAGAAGVANTNLPVGSLAAFSAVFNSTASSSRVNNSTASSGSVGTGNAGGLTLGARGGATNHANISTSELIVFPFAPSTALEARLIAGLMARHGVA